MDFGALPPEINSARMYSGPGSTPLLAAAVAWDSLAAELRSTASAYASVISGLAGAAWSGPAATSMSTTATCFSAWLSHSAAQTEEVATRARAAAAVYDTAFRATVPPPVIAANRSQLMALIATNIFGQHTAAIAATELHYAEMWAQDAAAMNSYAVASANAATLTPFNSPPPAANPIGLAAQGAAVAHAAPGVSIWETLSQVIFAAPAGLHGSPGAAPAQIGLTALLLSLLDGLSGPLAPSSLYGIGGVPYLLAIQCVLLPMNGSNVVAALARANKMTGEGTWPPNPFDLGGTNLDQTAPAAKLAGATAPAVHVGGAGAVGRLSVPQGWAAATPAAKTATAALPGLGSEAFALAAANTDSVPVDDLALGGLAGRAMGAVGMGTSQRVGARGSMAASKPSTATIIVIPPSARD